MLGPNNLQVRTGLFTGAAATARHLLGKHILPETPLWDSLYSIHGVNMQAIISKVPMVDIGVGLKPLLLGAAACFPGLAQLMEKFESLFHGYMIEHIDLLCQNCQTHTTFAFQDDANAKNDGPECNGEKDIEITLALFLMHSADPDGGSRKGIKIAWFPRFDDPLLCLFIVFKFFMSHCSR